MKRVCVILVCLLFLISCDMALPEKPKNYAHASPNLVDSGINYAESTQEIVNPERGFYKPISKQFAVSGNTPISQSYFNQYVSQYGLFHLRFGLEAFSIGAGGSDAPLSQDMLNALDATFDNLRNAGGTAIIRFSYNLYGLTQNGKYIEAEPSMSLIEQHISQLGAVIEDNIDVIAAVETGMFGPWGEQHSTIRATESPNNYYRLVEAWLDAVPPSRTISVRRPRYYVYWSSIKYDNGLTLGTIHNDITQPGTDEYRVGVYNDGYLGSSSDLGTFSDRTKETAWLSNQAVHTFYGGEVVADSQTGGIGSYNNIDYINYEGFITHTTYLNKEWNYTKVISSWENTTYTGDDPVYKNITSGYTYVSNHLGYRFVLRESLLYDEVEQGGTLSLQGKVENVGFGNVINEKKEEIIITDGTHTYKTECDIDVREWDSQAISDYSLTINLPSSLPIGNYDVYLKISELYEQLQDTAFRTIRFANDDADIWNESLGANYLGSFAIVEEVQSGAQFGTWGGTSGKVTISYPSGDVVKISYNENDISGAYAYTRVSDFNPLKSRLVIVYSSPTDFCWRVQYKDSSGTTKDPRPDTNVTLPAGSNRIAYWDGFTSFQNADNNLRFYVKATPDMTSNVNVTIHEIYFVDEGADFGAWGGTSGKVFISYPEGEEVMLSYDENNISDAYAYTRVSSFSPSKSRLVIVYSSSTNFCWRVQYKDSSGTTKDPIPNSNVTLPAGSYQTAYWDGFTGFQSSDNNLRFYLKPTPAYTQDVNVTIHAILFI